jgi:hypothetical protein
MASDLCREFNEEALRKRMCEIFLRSPEYPGALHGDSVFAQRAESPPDLAKHVPCMVLRVI